MKNQILLLEDVEALGRCGDIVSVKPGYARNFLLPKKKGVIAEKHLIRLQERLKEEREKKAIVDKQGAEALAKSLADKGLTTSVKIDAEGHMYGSVGQQEIVHMMKEQLGVELEKRNVVMPKPIKKLGVHTVVLKLKEGVPAQIALEINPEEQQV